MRQISGLDTLGASGLLRRLRDRGLLALHPAGAASDYTLSDALHVGPASAPADRGELAADRGELAPDRGELAPDRGELGTAPALPAPLRAALDELGARPRKDRLRGVLVDLCSLRPYTAAELGALVGVRGDKLVERHLSPMVEAGTLERTHPDRPTHRDQADQARRAQAASPFGSER